MTAAARAVRRQRVAESIARLADLHPPAPATLDESGLGEDLVMQLILKVLHFLPDASGLDLARRVGLPFSVIEPILDALKTAHQCEISAGLSMGGPTYRYRITDEGRRRALMFLEHSQYMGVAPVPLSQYRAYMQAYRAATPRTVSRARVRRAYSHLVLSEKVLDQVGPAVAAGQSMFVYGAPGNGKTVIAQAIRNLLDGEMAIPHALVVEGQIVTLYESGSHERLTDDDGAEDALMPGRQRDARWVRCRRPVVTVGAELTLEALELSYSPLTKTYAAPLQALANGGVLVIDDFGRQRCSPRELLNRWIVALESRVDNLTLRAGQRFDLPFTALVVFATNLRPSELVDEAFLRRIQYKVFAESPTRADFARIFENYCHRRGLAYDPSLVEHILTTYFRPRGIQMRGCQPRDLIERALAQAAYAGEPLRLTPELLEAACAGYFVDDTENAAIA